MANWKDYAASYTDANNRLLEQFRLASGGKPKKSKPKPRPRGGGY